MPSIWLCVANTMNHSYGVFFFFHFFVWYLSGNEKFVAVIKFQEKALRIYDVADVKSKFLKIHFTATFFIFLVVLKQFFKYLLNHLRNSDSLARMYDTIFFFLFPNNTWFPFELFLSPRYLSSIFNRHHHNQLEQRWCSVQIKFFSFLSTNATAAGAGGLLIIIIIII